MRPLKRLCESFHVSRGAVMWFATLEGTIAEGEQPEHVSRIVGQAHGPQMVRWNVEALLVHKYLLTPPAAFAKRIFKSMLASLTRNIYLLMTFNCHQSRVPHAHDSVSIVSCAFMLVANFTIHLGSCSTYIRTLARRTCPPTRQHHSVSSRCAPAPATPSGRGPSSMPGVL